MFKTHDVRGLLNTQINQGTFYTLGRATARVFRYEATTGRDYRTGHRVLESAFLAGFESEGGQVSTILGNVPTSVISEENDGLGLCFTASHNPAGYCGVKFFIKNRYCTQNDIIRLKEEYDKLGGQETIRVPAYRLIEPSMNSKETIWDYCEKLPPFQNAIYDLAGGAACALEFLFNKKIFYSPDPDFKHHSPEPMDSTLTDLKKKTINSKSLGFAFDGDADRVIAVDNGKTIEGHILLIELAKQNLSPNDKVVLSIDCPTEAFEKLEDEGFKPSWAPVGDINVIQKALECGAKIAGERSGHYSFLPDYPYSDGLRAASIASNSMKVGQLTKLSEEFKNICLIESVFVRADFNKIQNYLNEQKNIQEIITIDGIKATFDNFSILIRQSNTEPKIRINAESTSLNDSQYAINLAKTAIEVSKIN